MKYKDIMVRGLRRLGYIEEAESNKRKIFRLMGTNRMVYSTSGWHVTEGIEGGNTFPVSPEFKHAVIEAGRADD